jgi:hypothetical protein
MVAAGNRQPFNLRPRESICLLVEKRQKQRVARYDRLDLTIYGVTKGYLSNHIFKVVTADFRNRLTTL